jgi:hypothetical protein
MVLSLNGLPDTRDLARKPPLVSRFPTQYIPNERQIQTATRCLRNKLSQLQREYRDPVNLSATSIVYQRNVPLELSKTNNGTQGRIQDLGKEGRHYTVNYKDILQIKEGGGASPGSAPARHNTDFKSKHRTNFPGLSD